MGKQTKGIFFVFMGALFWSLNAPLIKYIYLDSMTVNLCRCLLGGLVLLPFFLKAKITVNKYFLIQVISFSLNCILVVNALKMTGSAIAIGMQYTAAFWLFLYECIRTKRIDRQKALPVMIIFLGIVMFMMSSKTVSIEGNILAFLSGICFAVMTFAGNKVETTNPLAITCVDCFVAAGISFLFRFDFVTSIHFLGLKEWMIIIILGVIQTGFGYGFYNIGLKTVSADAASIIAIWEMILGPLWVGLFLMEYPSKFELIGMIFVVMGLIIKFVESRNRSVI